MQVEPRRYAIDRDVDRPRARPAGIHPKRLLPEGRACAPQSRRAADIALRTLSMQPLRPECTARSTHCRRVFAPVSLIGCRLLAQTFVTEGYSSGKRMRKPSSK